MFTLIIGVACSPNMSDDPIPITVFPAFAVSLSLPEYQSLAVDGGYKYITLSPTNGKSVGVRGIILYRKNSSTFIAFERNCTFQPNDACATVNVDASNLFLIDPCCRSMFNLTDGKPYNGIAWRPLRQYKTNLSNGAITISSEIIN